MLRLSIVIPCLGNDQQFDATLVSVLQNQPDNSEVILALPREYSDPYELGDSIRCVAGDADATLVELTNAGCALAKGEILHILDARCEVAEGWADEALSRFDEPEVGGVSCVLLRGENPTQIVATGARLNPLGQVQLSRSMRGKLAATRLAGFYRRDLWELLGGFDEELPAAYDVDLGMKLARLNRRTVVERTALVHLLDANRVMPQTLAAAVELERVFWRHGARAWSAAMLHFAAQALQMATHLGRGGLTRGLASLLGASYMWEREHQQRCLETWLETLEDLSWDESTDDSADDDAMGASALRMRRAA